MTAYQQQIDRLRNSARAPPATTPTAPSSKTSQPTSRSSPITCTATTHTFDRWTPPATGRVADRPAADSAVLGMAVLRQDRPGGVTGELVLVHGLRKNWRAAAGKIAVIEVQNLDVPARLLLDSWEGDLPFETVANPVIGSELAGTDLTKAREAGVLGVVAVWHGIADAAAHGPYLPFTRDFQDVPAVWVPESARRDVLNRGREQRDRHPHPQRAEDTRVDGHPLGCLSRNRPPRERVSPGRHAQDGGNAVEENGHTRPGRARPRRSRNWPRPHDRVRLRCWALAHPRGHQARPSHDAWLEAHPRPCVPGRRRADSRRRARDRTPRRPPLRH